VPTFLTTPKMDPALAARVEASVTGKPVDAAKSVSPRTMAFLRFAGILGAIGIIAWIAIVRRQANDALEADRNSLLTQLHEHSSQATASDKTLLPRIETWVREHSGEYEGDLVDDSVRGENMAATLANPIIYLRGPIEGFKTDRGIVDMAPTTFRDALVLCLFDPPEKSTEKTLREAAKAVLSGSDRLKKIGHVSRFHTARVGLPFLQPQWEERVKATEDSRQIAEMRRQLKQAALENSVKAMKSRLLLAVMDEPKDGNGPSEIDGANRHYVRVMLVDMEADKVLLRQRKLVDPAWIPTSRRSDYANGINSCELGMEIRAVMTGTAPPSREQ
jgi:hypothetical protein